MQPKSRRYLSAKDSRILIRTMANTEKVFQGLKSSSSYCTELPQIVGIKLTNRCNLRCRTCYEWNEQGYHRDMTREEQNSEIDIAILKKVIEETDPVRANLYLWGGEPLYYTKFEELSYLLENRNRITAICTNGQLLRQKMDSILRMGEYLELLLAVDGLEYENDSIRGKGTFKETVSAIEELLSLRKEGIFKGKISIHCVISEEMVGKLYEFLCRFEDMGVDTVILCYPWYISERTSGNMDEYYAKHIGNLCKEKPSWYAFKYQLPVEFYDRLMEDKKRIMDKVWNIPVKFQPELNDEEIMLFIKDDLPLQAYHCYSVADRMEVLPDGSVSSCKHFPEMVVGNLKDSSVYELWHSPKYTEIRTAVQNGLMPVCTKCNNLYLHGKKGLHEE